VEQPLLHRENAMGGKRVPSFRRKPLPAYSFRGLAMKVRIGFQIGELVIERQIEPVGKDFLMLLDERFVKLSARLLCQEELTESVTFGLVL
jgi:hypothetical protein